MKKLQQEQIQKLKTRDKKPAKKKFVKPEIKQHQRLPEITTAYIGTFKP